tara:strand:+ start:10988 stop:11674 length:687 start_codon:yes stop_codon:yes gene_type:complete
MNSSTLRIDLTEFAAFIHQAALTPSLSDELLNQICSGSQQFNIPRLCTDLIRLERAKELIGSKSQTKLITVIGFPFGNIPNKFKRSEAEWAINKGAEELEVVPNLLALCQGKINIFAEELAQLCEIGSPMRSILDINQIPREKLSLAIEASIDAGVSGIQVGNGFGPPISQEQIREVSLLVKDRSAIKAVGGIKTIQHAMTLIEAGATEIGTSFGIEMLQAIRAENKH